MIMGINLSQLTQYLQELILSAHPIPMGINLSGLTQYQWELILSAHPIPMGINSVSPPNADGN
jgi:hypothetical protein